MELTILGGASAEDCVATITRITAQSLTEAYQRWGPKGGVDEIYMGGGGSYNPNIINYLRQQMPNTKIVFLDEVGIPAGAKEALGFALLGCECFVGRPMIVPRRTESDIPGVVGQIQPGRNHHRIRQHVAQVSGYLDFCVAGKGADFLGAVLERLPRGRYQMHDKDEFFAIFVRLTAEPGLVARNTFGLRDRMQSIMSTHCEMSIHHLQD